MMGRRTLFGETVALAGHDLFVQWARAGVRDCEVLKKLSTYICDDVGKQEIEKNWKTKGCENKYNACFTYRESAHQTSLNQNKKRKILTNAQLIALFTIGKWRRELTHSAWREHLGFALAASARALAASTSALQRDRSFDFR